MKKNHLLIFLLIPFFSYAQVPWNQTGDNNTSGSVLIAGNASSADSDDIVIDRNKPNAGMKIFNADLTGRSVLLFGSDYGGKYGYLAHHGKSHNGGAGYSETYKPSSTVLVGADINGLGIISTSDIRFSAGGSEDSKQRMIISSEGNVGVGNNEPWEKLHINGTIGIGKFSNTPHSGLKIEYTDGGSGTTVFKHQRWGGGFYFKRNGPEGERTQLFFGGAGDHYMDIYNSNNEVKIRLTTNGNTFFADGNVGIGTLTPTARFHVAGSVFSNATRTNTVFNGSPNADNANFIGSEGYWALRTATDNSYNLDVYNGASPLAAMTVLQNGHVGIGTINPGDYRLAVEGKIGAREIMVTTSSFADYVFEDQYKLMSIDEVASFIKKNRHLPNIPTANEVVQNGGVNVGDMQVKLLEKVEELTLYLIEQDKKVELCHQDNIALRKEIQKLKK